MRFWPRRPGRRVAALLAIAAVLAALGGFAYASIPDADGVIHGCIARSGGLRVIDTESGQTCTSRETPLAWNQAGPASPVASLDDLDATPCTLKGAAGTLDVSYTLDGVAHLACVVPTTLTGTSVALGSQTAGAITTAPVDFTTAKVLPAGDRLEVMFPDGFDVSGASVVTELWTLGSMSGTSVVLVRESSIPAGSAVSLTLAGVRNPLLPGTTHRFALATETATGDVVDYGTAPGLLITP